MPGTHAYTMAACLQPAALPAMEKNGCENGAQGAAIGHCVRGRASAAAGGEKFQPSFRALW